MTSHGAMRKPKQAGMNYLASENASSLQKVSIDSNNSTDAKSKMLYLVTRNLQMGYKQEIAIDTFFNLHCGKCIHKIQSN